MLPKEFITLSKIADPRGNLTVIENVGTLPFTVKRVYWLYDVPAGESRGGHAHKSCQEVLIALNGSFHVTLHDGKKQHTYLLNHPYQGLLVDKNIWRTLDDFSSGTVCLVLASEAFCEEDYIRNFQDFLNQTK